MIVTVYRSISAAIQILVYFYTSRLANKINITEIPERKATCRRHRITSRPVLGENLANSIDALW